MAYVSGFQYDLFISYARENNKTGWVSYFVDSLVKELRGRLGPAFSRESLFFDTKTASVDGPIPEWNARAAETSALLVPVLSPHYLKSEWCDSERRVFFTSPERLRLPVEDVPPASRVVPILVRPIRFDVFGDSHPAFSFLQPGELEPLPAGSADFLSSVSNFANRLSDALKAFRSQRRPVFLGRALPNGEALRARVAAELAQRQNHVVPAAGLFLDHEARVRELLERAAFSVHFIGGASKPALQTIQLAMDVCPVLSPE